MDRTAACSDEWNRDRPLFDRFDAILKVGRVSPDIRPDSERNTGGAPQTAVLNDPFRLVALYSYQRKGECRHDGGIVPSVLKGPSVSCGCKASCEGRISPARRASASRFG